MTIIIYSLITIFATSAILEAWFHEDGIFENIRNKLSLWLLNPNCIIPIIIADKIAQLLNCRKCFTYWVTAVSFLLILISGMSPYTSFILYIFIIFAIIRGVHIVDACFDCVWSHIVEDPDE